MSAPNKRILVEMSDDLHKEFKEIATKNEISMSLIVRDAIKDYIAKKKKNVIY